MKLDRNINKDGKGKYALIQLRKVEVGSKDWIILCDLASRGILEWGSVGSPDEFFLFKLKDIFSDAGLRGYEDAVLSASNKCVNTDEAQSKSLMEYAREIQSLRGRAGILSEFCKLPD